MTRSSGLFVGNAHPSHAQEEVKWVNIYSTCMGSRGINTEGDGISKVMKSQMEQSDELTTLRRLVKVVQSYCARRNGPGEPI